MSRRRRLLAGVAVAAVLAAGGLAFWQVRSPPRRGVAGLRFEMADGLRRLYAVQGAAEVRVDVAALPAGAGASAAGGASGVAEVLGGWTGELRLRFYGDGKDGWNVAAWLRSPRIATNGAEPSWAWAVVHPFTFHLGPRGAVKDVAFTPLLPAEAQAFLLRIASGLQVSLPSSPAQVEWVAIEGGPEGEAEVAYARTAADPGKGTLQGTRQVRARSALPAPPGTPALARLGTETLSSSGTFHVSTRTWITDLETKEEVAFVADGKRWAVSRGGFSVHALDRDAGDFPETFAAFQSVMRAQSWIEAALRHGDPELDELARGLDPEGAIARWVELSRKDRGLADRFLVNYLRRDDSASLALLRIVDADVDMRRLDEKTQLVLWMLVVEAGTPAAQRAVLQAARDPSFHHGSHVRAIMNAVDFVNPQPFLVDGFMALHRDPAAASGDDPLGAVRNMSLLAVGSLGFREKLDEATRAAAATALVDNLSRARDDGAEAALTLQAIGNTGNDGLLGTVKPYLEAPEERVRASAFESMRRMDSPAAQEQLVQAYGKEAAAPVRAAALAALAEMPLTPASLAWAREAVKDARTPGDAVGLVDVLGLTLARNPQNEAALRALLVPGAPEAVKVAVYKYLAPR